MVKHSVTLYVNGNTGATGFPTSFSHKKFNSVEKFMEHINEELAIAKRRHGYKYLFDIKGRPVTSNDDIEYGQSYVIALDRKFIDIDYEGLDRSLTNMSKNSSKPRHREDVYSDYESSQVNNSAQKEDEKQPKDNKDRKDRSRKGTKKDSTKEAHNRDTVNTSNGGSGSFGGDKKEILVYQNGNHSDPGSNIAFYPEDFEGGRISSFISYINEQLYLLGLSTGHRRVYTVDGEEIRRVSDIERGGRYVVAGGSFIKVEYGKRALNLKGKQKQRSNQQRKRYEKSRNNFRQSKNHTSDICVTIFRNGDIDDFGAKTDVPEQYLQSVEKLLNFVKYELGSLGRGVRNIYTEEGHRVKSTRQIQDGDRIVVGSGIFIPITYGERKKRTRRISQTKKSLGSKTKRSRSDGDLKRRPREKNGSSSDSDTESSTDPYSNFSDCSTCNSNDDRYKSFESEDYQDTRNKRGKTTRKRKKRRRYSR